jgi:hypothetical protein
MSERKRTAPVRCWQCWQPGTEADPATPAWHEAHGVLSMCFHDRCLPTGWSRTRSVVSGHDLEGRASPWPSW